MKDYNNIYQAGSSKANSDLQEASSLAKQAQISTSKLEELTALVSTQIAEENKFSNFKEKYNTIMSNNKISQILEGRDRPSAREVYESGTIEIADNLSMPFSDLEALVIVENFKDKIDLKTTVKNMFKK